MADEVKRAIGELKSKLKETEKWVPETIEGAINGVVSGAFTSVCLDFFFNVTEPVQLPLSPIEHKYLSECGGYRPLVESFILGSGWEHARTVAVSAGVAKAIIGFMKTVRGKEDVQSRLVSGFGAGVTMSLVTGVRGSEVISTGLMCALMSGGLFKLSEILLMVKAKVVPHSQTRDKFSGIGVDINHHAMNFNTGFFTSNALSLRNDHRNEMKKGGGGTWFR